MRIAVYDDIPAEQIPERITLCVGKKLNVAEALDQLDENSTINAEVSNTLLKVATLVKASNETVSQRYFAPV